MRLLMDEERLTSENFWNRFCGCLAAGIPDSAVKRVKVSPITSTDDEATQPPPVAPTCTASSPFHEDSSVTLSANSSVTKPGSETLARNSDQQLGCRAASSTPQEVTGEPEDQMHGKCSRCSCEEYVADEVRFCTTTFYKKLPELQCTCDHQIHDHSTGWVSG
ncbi:hypothetical protein K469DRAFT_721041 [Zopfia rhizophila CBS 207.26]|uniref:Uncharacterized protein n=1 Tax=Zopfia rhizophila CBS 207.26 TaxID=1314779 RepID=A0A6A6DD91_9PEZI|nr:hypothetical protein K469DRAFT_721041 [Zopfia rhizophila CBS 207.26]